MCSAQIIRLPAVPPSETRCLHWQCTHKLTDPCTSSRLWTQALDCELLPQSVPLPELFERLSGHTCRRSARAINGKKRPEIHVSQAHNAHAVLDKALCAAVTYYTHDSLPTLVADSCHAVIDLPRSMSSGLKAFILRTEVITLYRNFCKAVRQAPDHTKGDLKEQIRAGFELHRGIKDLYAVKYHLSDGRVQLKMLQEMMAMKL